MTQMLAPATVPGFADFAGLAGVVETTRLNTSEFLYYVDVMWMNCTADELVFAFSFVSSHNTDVEITEQFILLHTRYVFYFSGSTNFAPKLLKLEENIYIALCLLIRLSCF